MKWSNRVRGKRKIPSVVTFDEIDSWLELVSQSLFRGLSTNTDQLYGMIGDTQKSLKQNTARLQDAERGGKASDFVAKRGLPNRDIMVKHLRSLAEKILIPTQTDYKTVLSFYRVSISNLEFPFGKSLKNIRYVRSLFPDETKAIISDLKRLKILLNRLIAPIKGKEDLIADLEQASEIIQDIKDLRSGLEEEKEKVYDQEEECSALKSKIETEKKRLRAIEEGKEWTRFKELKTKLSSLEDELNVLESDIGSLFFPLNKTLSLLKKQDETGRHTLTPEERKAILSILSSPIQALSEGDVTDFLCSIKNVIEGEVSILKDQKREKALKWINHLLSIELFEIKDKRERLQSRIEETRGAISSMTILKDKEETEESIVSVNRQLTRLQEGKARSKRHTVSLEAELTEKKRLLLEALERIARKEIEVKFDAVV
jgi:hypothetical protein